MTSQILGCAGGTYGDQDGSAPVALAVTVDVPGITAAQTDAGILSSAYVGQTATNATGQFCAPVSPGTTVQLSQPGFACPKGPSPAPAPTFTVPAQQGPGACAAGGCFDAGDVFYGCY